MVKNDVAERMITAMKTEIRSENILAFRLKETVDKSASFLVKRDVFATKWMMNFTIKLRRMM
tara:strand:- start:2020 stop:2205 length:186 start_codon:yes stop_codon:yes gene_type:complete